VVGDVLQGLHELHSGALAGDGARAACDPACRRKAASGKILTV
jgi:hypothetical protein